MITASVLRQNIYRILDQVIETGVPVQIHRKGKILEIEPPVKEHKLTRLRKHRILKVHPQKIVHMNWSKEWKS